MVSSVEYAETGGNNRRGNVVLGGSADDPLITTVTYYKGPAAQKVFSVARTTEASDDLWRGSEATRSIFALTRVEIKFSYGDDVASMAWGARNLISTHRRSPTPTPPHPSRRTRRSSRSSGGLETPSSVACAS